MITPISNKEMKNLTSMKTGGVAENVYFPKTEEEMCKIVSKLNSENKKYVLLGNASNVLLPEGIIKAVLIVTTEMKSTCMTDEVTLRAAAGASLTKLSIDACRKGLSGLEFAYGIPGTVGGAVYMNAGAYGGEIKDVVKSVRVLDKDGNVLEIPAEECGFDYRKSSFQNDEFVILGACFCLKKANADECVRTAKEFMQKRIDKQPLDFPSCGSTFKRPEGYFAGALVEEAGLKGSRVGGAEVSPKHAGFVVNAGGATTDDVVSLMREVRRAVKEKSGVTLEAEIKLLDNNGDFFEL